jgi:hypothetical protein
MIKGSSLAGAQQQERESKIFDHVNALFSSSPTPGQNKLERLSSSRFSGCSNICKSGNLPLDMEREH